jgi:hypothetical protein
MKAVGQQSLQRSLRMYGLSSEVRFNEGSAAKRICLGDFACQDRFASEQRCPSSRNSPSKSIIPAANKRILTIRLS